MVNSTTVAFGSESVKVKTLEICSSLEPTDKWHWDLECSIGDVGPTRFARMMDLG